MSATLEIMPYRVRLTQGEQGFRVTTACMRHTKPAWWFFKALVPGSEDTNTRCVLRALWLSADRIDRRSGRTLADGGVSVLVETGSDDSGACTQFELEFQVETHEDRMRSADWVLGVLMSKSPPDWLFEDRCVCLKVPLVH